MGYSAISFSAGEQPTTAKWNILGSNDASFNDGTGIGTNAISGASLSTSAIKLGLAKVTSSQSTSSASFSTIPGMSLTVTVPAGGRDVEIMVFLAAIGLATANGTYSIAIYKDGSPIQQAVIDQQASATNRTSFTVFAEDVAPTAGSHTYTAQWGVFSAGQVLSLTAGAGTSTGQAVPGYSFIEAKLV